MLDEGTDSRLPIFRGGLDGPAGLLGVRASTPAKARLRSTAKAFQAGMLRNM